MNDDAITKHSLIHSIHCSEFEITVLAMYDYVETKRITEAMPS